MPELQWFELNPPRGLDVAALTALIRPLADRPRSGFASATPPVVFEVWGLAGKVQYRIGLDGRIARDVVRQMPAHLPRLGLVPLGGVSRPSLLVAAEVSLGGMATLRLDIAPAVSAGLLTSLRQGLQGGEHAVLQWVLGPAHPRQTRPTPFDLSAALGLTAPRKPDATATRLWRAKAAEPLFACRGRIGAKAASVHRASVIVRNLGGALKLTSSQHAALRLSKTSPARARKLVEIAVPLRWSVLNAAEVAAVLGWPLDDVPTEGLPVIGGHINPTPAALRLDEAMAAGRPDERVLGASLHPAESGDLVTVPVNTSLHHLHVIGPTGSGKSTLLAELITADVDAGRSVLVLEPKGDLVNDVLARIPPNRRDDVIVIEPNAGRSVGFNVLAGKRGEAERRADQIVSLLAELHGANFGPRTSDVALHALISVSRLPDGTLVDVPVLLSNPAFRRRVLTAVNDPLVLGPFWSWYDALSDAERGQVIAPLLNKLRAFLSRDALRWMLGQSQARFDLEELFIKRRVVLINLNKGLLGHGVSSLLGALILTQFWAMVQRRSAVPTAKRHPVMAVIDEVQDYLHLPGVDLGDFFAQARGLGVSLTIAHQHLHQLNAIQQAGVLANARSRVVFRPAPGDAKALAAALGSGLTADDLLRLRAFEACCQLHVDGQPAMPFSVRTRPLPPWSSDPAELRRISGERYGVDGSELDTALTERWHGGGGTPDGPIGFKPRRSS